MIMSTKEMTETSQSDLARLYLAELAKHAPLLEIGIENLLAGTGKLSLPELLVSVRSIKNSSRTCGFINAFNLAESIENVLFAINQDRAELTVELMVNLQQTSDLFSSMLYLEEDVILEILENESEIFDDYRINLDASLSQNIKSISKELPAPEIRIDLNGGLPAVISNRYLRKFSVELARYSHELETSMTKFGKRISRKNIRHLLLNASTIKGEAKILGVAKAAALASSVEKLLSAAENNKIYLTEERIDALIKCSELFKEITIIETDDAIQSIDITAAEIEDYCLTLDSFLGRIDCPEPEENEENKNVGIEKTQTELDSANEQFQIESKQVPLIALEQVGDNDTGLDIIADSTIDLGEEENKEPLQPKKQTYGLKSGRVTFDLSNLLNPKKNGFLKIAEAASYVPPPLGKKAPKKAEQNDEKNADIKSAADLLNSVLLELKLSPNFNLSVNELIGSATKAEILAERVNLNMDRGNPELNQKAETLAAEVKKLRSGIEAALIENQSFTSDLSVRLESIISSLISCDKEIKEQPFLIFRQGGIFFCIDAKYVSRVVNSGDYEIKPNYDAEMIETSDGVKLALLPIERYLVMKKAQIPLIRGAVLCKYENNEFAFVADTIFGVSKLPAPKPVTRFPHKPKPRSKTQIGHPEYLDLPSLFAEWNANAHVLFV